MPARRAGRFVRRFSRRPRRSGPGPWPWTTPLPVSQPTGMPKLPITKSPPRNRPESPARRSGFSRAATARIVGTVEFTVIDRGIERDSFDHHPIRLACARPADLEHRWQCQALDFLVITVTDGYNAFGACRTVRRAVESGFEKAFRIDPDRLMLPSGQRDTDAIAFATIEFFAALQSDRTALGAKVD